MLLGQFAFQIGDDAVGQLTGLCQITDALCMIELGAGAPVQDIEILNNGATKAYLDLSIAEIVDPGAAEPTRVALDDPRSAPVLVSPRQLLVPPGARKRVRVILREGSEGTDRVYRLRVEPYSGKARLAEAGAMAGSLVFRSSPLGVMAMISASPLWPGGVLSCIART